MDWKNLLRPASFKGIPFKVEDIEIKGGQRVAKFEFPKLNTPATEPMGRKQRVYTVSAYILGDEYVNDLKNLQNALESDGEGVLIHPFYGELKVLCEDFSIKQSLNKDGGLGLVSMSFVEAGKVLFPSSSNDEIALLGENKNNAIDSSKKSFAKKFSVAGKGQLLIDSASSQVGNVAGTMNSSLKGVKGESLALSSAGYAIRNLSSKASSLVSDPMSLANSIGDSLGGFSSSVSGSSSTIGGAFSALKKIIKSDSSKNYTQNGLTETRKQQMVNERAIDTLVKEVATAEMAEQAIYVEHDSLEDAQIAQESVLQDIDSVIQNTDDDDVYYNFSALRSQIVKLIPRKDKQLPSIRKIKNTKTTNSLKMSYEFYGNLENEEDILKRNKIKAPYMISAEKELEVLSE